MSASLQEWIEAALTVADSNGMSDDEVIPTWPADVADHYPDLTVGALRRWQAGRAEHEVLELLRGYLPEIKSVLRSHRYCGDQYPTSGWPEVSSLLAKLQRMPREAKQGSSSEQDIECREFAKLYRFVDLGQVLATLDTSGDEKADALITFQFWPGVEGLGVCSTYLGFIDDESEGAADKAEKVFSDLTPEMAERIVGETARKIRESWGGAEDAFTVE
ncbi:MAG: hypothetical protein HLX50_08955 [Alteromonadaceae bacterium]|nr:hypothetical protein [Alteromonadaceae bacterium]